jgi:hypothetical protein
MHLSRWTVAGWGLQQEIVLAHLIMAGTITDREAAGIDLSRATYVKAKPRLKAYMEQHRASVRAVWSNTRLSPVPCHRARDCNSSLIQAAPYSDTILNPVQREALIEELTLSTPDGEGSHLPLLNLAMRAVTDPKSCDHAHRAWSCSPP